MSAPKRCYDCNHWVLSEYSCDCPDDCPTCSPEDCCAETWGEDDED